VDLCWEIDISGAPSCAESQIRVDQSWEVSLCNAATSSDCYHAAGVTGMAINLANCTCSPGHRSERAPHATHATRIHRGRPHRPHRPHPTPTRATRRSCRSLCPRATDCCVRGPVSSEQQPGGDCTVPVSGCACGQLRWQILRGSRQRRARPAVLRHRPRLVATAGRKISGSRACRGLTTIN
jgi:hypothetical protein